MNARRALKELKKRGYDVVMFDDAHTVIFDKNGDRVAWQPHLGRKGAHELTSSTRRLLKEIGILNG